MSSVLDTIKRAPRWLRRQLRERFRLYKSPEQIAKDIIRRASKKHADSWCGVAKVDLILAHHSTGRAIRNKYHLWDAHNPYTTLNDVASPHFPDQVSMTIMELIWQHFSPGEPDDSA